MSYQDDKFYDPNKPPPPPGWDLTETANPSSADFGASTPLPGQRGASPEPEPIEIPQTAPDGQVEQFQVPPPPPPAPPGVEVYAEPVANEWDDAVEEAEAVEEIEPAQEIEEAGEVEPIALEVDPEVAGAEIIHERKAFKEEYLVPSLDDEKAIFNAMLKEISGIRKEMETLNKIIARLAEKLENQP